ncbi:MAG: hypothetical protein QF831_05710, partial [Candidatus Thalassarchaeaceae archaeon]|nr:hypothetical protein [Candidatus Thalassarchaeaceae archaeon]
MYSTTSDEGGEFEILDLKEGDYTLSANLAGYNGVSESIHLNSTYAATFSLKMEEPARVSGVVLDLTRNVEEQQLFGVVVQLSGILDGEQIYGPLETFTNESGAYEFNDLPALDYNLTFATVGYALYETQVSLSAGDDVTRDASMVIQASAIEVRLVSPTYVDGENNPMPLQNIDIELHGLTNSAGRGIDRTASSDENGIVLFENLIPPGSYVIQIRENAQTIDGITLEFGGAEWTARELLPEHTFHKNISLNPLSSTISGHLHTKNDVNYVANVYAEVQSDDDAIYETADDGFFIYGFTNPQVHSLLGTEWDKCGFLFIGLYYDRNRICEDPPFILEEVEGASISVTESKLGAYHVAYDSDELPSIMSGSEGNAGNFAITLPPANHKIKIEKSGHQTQNFGGYPQPVSSNQSFTFFNSILLAPDWSHLIGFIERNMVYNENGTPVQSSVNAFGMGPADWYHNPRVPLVQTTIRLTPQDEVGEVYTAETDERGFFELRKVPAGEYTVSADGHSLTSNTNITIPAGGKVIAIDRGATTSDLATFSVFQDGIQGNTLIQITDETKNSVDMSDQYTWGNGASYKLPKDDNYTIRAYGDLGTPGYRVIHWDARNDTDSSIQISDTSGDIVSSPNGYLPISQKEFSGFVYDVGGKPLENVNVNVTVDVQYYIQDPQYPNCEECHVLLPAKSKNYSVEINTSSDGSYVLTRSVSSLNISSGYASLSIRPNSELYYGGCGIKVAKIAYQSLASSCIRGGTGAYDSRRVDFYMWTTGALEGNVTINGTSEAIPRMDVRADGKTTVWTNSSGGYQFSPIEPGPVDVYFEAYGYYPEMAQVTVLKPPSITVPKTTYQDMEMEPIPHPKADRNSFKIMTGDGNGGMAELNGYVLKGVEGSTPSENELTNGYWEVDVYREKLRPEFEDPIVRVLLIVKVKSQCESNEDVAPNGTTLRFPGTLDVGPSGERGKSTWIGMLDVANDLPCGELEFEIVVTTAMGFENDEDDEDTTQVEVSTFPIRPAMPSYLLSLFLDLDEANLPTIESDYLGFEHGDSSMSRDGHHV